MMNCIKIFTWNNPLGLLLKGSPVWFSNFVTLLQSQTIPARLGLQIFNQVVQIFRLK